MPPRTRKRTATIDCRGSLLSEPGKALTGTSSNRPKKKKKQQKTAADEPKWEFERVVEEKLDPDCPGSRLLLISWSGTDPETGLKWENSWIPDSNLDQADLAKWDAAKQPPQNRPIPEETPKNRKSKPDKLSLQISREKSVVESADQTSPSLSDQDPKEHRQPVSPEGKHGSETSHLSDHSASPSFPTTDEYPSPEAAASENHDRSALDLEVLHEEDVQIRITLPSQFDRHDYQIISQISRTSAPSTQEAPSAPSLYSTSRKSAIGSRAQIIPDSQSQLESTLSEPKAQESDEVTGTQSSCPLNISQGQASPPISTPRTNTQAESSESPRSRDTSEDIVTEDSASYLASQASYVPPETLGSQYTHSEDLTGEEHPQGTQHSQEHIVHSIESIEGDSPRRPQRRNSTFFEIVLGSDATEVNRDRRESSSLHSSPNKPSGSASGLRIAQSTFDSQHSVVSRFSSLSKAPLQIPSYAPSTPPPQRLRTPSTDAAMSQPSGTPSSGRESIAERFRRRVEPELGSILRAEGFSSRRERAANSKSPMSLSPGVSSTRSPRPSSPHAPAEQRTSSTNPSGALVQVESTSANITGSVDGNVFYLPINLATVASDTYKAVFRYNRDFVSHISDNTDSSSNQQVLDRARAVVDELYNACSHPDLSYVPATAFAARSAETQASWAFDASTKFAFLQTVVEHSKHLEKHLVLFVKPGHLVDLLEDLLKQLEVSYARPDKHRSNISTSGPSRVTLLHTGKQGGDAVEGRADLVIGFDESFRLDDPQVLQVRHGVLNSDRLCPTVQLITTYTVEHVAFRMRERQNQDIDVLQLLVRADVNKNRVGNLHHGMPPAQDLAKRVATQLITGFQQPEALPSILSFTFHEDEGIATSHSEGSDTSRFAGHKRPADPILEESGASTPSKRPRVDSQEAAQRAISQENTFTLTGVADSVKAASLESSVGDPHAERVSPVKERINALEQELVSKNAQFLSLELDFSNRQSRFEDQERENNRLKEQMTAAQKLVDAAAAKRSADASKIADLALKVSSVQEELKTMCEALATSDDKSKQALAELSEKAAKIAPLERKLDYAKKEADRYLEAYRAASSSADERASEIEALRIENEDLKEKASHQAVKLRQLFQNDSVKAMRRDLKKSRAENEQHKRALQIALEDNRQLQDRLEEQEYRAGMSLNTRSSSLPTQRRSPGPAALAATRILQGPPATGSHTSQPQGQSMRGTKSANVSQAGSRAASPVAGHSAHSAPKTSPLQHTVQLANSED